MSIRPEDPNDIVSTPWPGPDKPASYPASSQNRNNPKVVTIDASKEKSSIETWAPVADGTREFLAESLGPMLFSIKRNQKDRQKTCQHLAKHPANPGLGFDHHVLHHDCTGQHGY